ncbi:MAG: PQQ-dependent dehydrogenase, methanol/ethanol family [Acidobacteriota bacterium]
MDAERFQMIARCCKAVLASAAVIALGYADTSAQIPYQRLLHADTDPSNWLTYSGGYQSQRFSALNQITRQNVGQLKTTWVYQLRQPGLFEASPIVADGIMYITEPPSTVTALDVRTGRPLWTWSPQIPRDVITISAPSPVNRGVAVLDDMVFVGTVVGHLTALDAKSGAVRWDVVVEDNKHAYFLTLAPLALDGKIIVGVSGAEAGIRGFIDAYDSKSGRRLWRTHTVPSPGEPGSDTWGKESWKTGGGSTWLTGSFDPDLNLLYWGTGNPGPDLNGDDRPGDNLYTCSLLALSPADGKVKWHFQFTPHDTHDWDANQIPVLFDATVDGRTRKLVGTANRNGFYYVLDRSTGEFVTGTAYAKQNWTEGLDAKGRPRVRPGTDPTVDGLLTYPGLSGAANWHSPTYSPQTKLFYQAVKEMGTYFFKGEAKYEVGRVFDGGGFRQVGGDSASGAIRALDATTGKPKWDFPLLSPPWTSLLSTAGGLVFGGTEEGNFLALDADTGKLLWDIQLGGAVRAGNPISFAVDGKQYVTTTAGTALFVFGLP